MKPYMTTERGHIQESMKDILYTFHARYTDILYTIAHNDTCWTDLNNLYLCFSSLSGLISLDRRKALYGDIK